MNYGEYLRTMKYGGGQRADGEGWWGTRRAKALANLLQISFPPRYFEYFECSSRFLWCPTPIKRTWSFWHFMVSCFLPLSAPKIRSCWGVNISDGCFHFNLNGNPPLPHFCLRLSSNPLWYSILQISLATKASLAKVHLLSCTNSEIWIGADLRSF